MEMKNATEDWEYSSLFKGRGGEIHLERGWKEREDREQDKTNKTKMNQQTDRQTDISTDRQTD